jgi:hypothetical protein
VEVPDLLVKDDTPRRGWTSSDLLVVSPDDPSYWSVTDAAMLLGGGIVVEQVRNLIQLTGMKPAGKRRGSSRSGGRYVRVYPAVDLIKAYEAVAEIIHHQHTG